MARGKLSTDEVPTIELEGSATTGIIVSDQHRALLTARALPTSVRLGAHVRRHTLRNVPHLGDFVNPKKLTLPNKVDWYTKAAESMARMYLNDRYGDCVIAGKAHNFGIWSANDDDSPGIILASDDEIYSQYVSFCGYLGRDSGCIIDDVLTKIMKNGFKMGGKTYNIDGFCAVDWTKQDFVKVALLLTGACSIGIDLPAAWTRDAVWDETNTSIVGGHDVSPVGYDDTGVYVASWGRIYKITWKAFMSTRWLGEMWVMLSSTWYGANKKSPSGLDTDALKAAMEKFKQNVLPDVEPPAPPPPPVPPAPPPPPVPPPIPPHLKGTFVGMAQIPILGKAPITGTIDLSQGAVGSGEVMQGIPIWLIPLVLKYGSIAIPIIIADLAQGKKFAQIVQDVIAAVLASRRAVGATNYDLWTLMQDLGKILSDLGNKNFLAVIQDFVQFLKDLGVNLPFQPHQLQTLTGGTELRV